MNVSRMPVSIAVAVVLHEGRVLVGQRPQGGALAGFWEFPGGKAQPGETPEAAAVRECLEETGMAVTITGLLEEVEHVYEHGYLLLRFFSATPVDASTAPESPFRWLPLHLLEEDSFPPANRRVISRLLTLHSG